MAAINSICRPMFFSSGTMATSTSQGFNSNLGFNSHQNLSRNLSVGGNLGLKCHSNLSQNLSSWGQSLMRKITSSTEVEVEAGISGLAPDFTLKTLGPQSPPMKAHDPHPHLRKLREHLKLRKWAPSVTLKTIGPQQLMTKIPNPHLQMYYEIILEHQLAGLELRKLELRKLGMEDTPEKQLDDIRKVKFACAFVVGLLLARTKYGPYCPVCCNNGS